MWIFYLLLAFIRSIIFDTLINNELPKTVSQQLQIHMILNLSISPPDAFDSVKGHLTRTTNVYPLWNQIRRRQIPNKLDAKSTNHEKSWHARLWLINQISLATNIKPIKFTCSGGSSWHLRSSTPQRPCNMSENVFKIAPFLKGWGFSLLRILFCPVLYSEAGATFKLTLMIIRCEWSWR